MAGLAGTARPHRARRGPAGRRAYLAGLALAAQVALREAGRVRVLAATGCVLAGRRRWYPRVAGPLVTGVRGPREREPAPVPFAVTGAVHQPDGVAADLLAALYAVLPSDLAATLAGAALVSSARHGGTLVGWSGRWEPGVAESGDAARHTRPDRHRVAALVSQICTGDPLDSGPEASPARSSSRSRPGRSGTRPTCLPRSIAGPGAGCPPRG